MKAENYIFVLCVVGILSACAFGEVESAPELFEPVLIGQPNPALAGIDKVIVIVAPADNKPVKDGLVWKELESKVRKKLKEAGIKTELRTAGGISSIPELRVYVEMLKFTKSDVYVFRGETTVAMESQLKDKNLYFKAEVWWSKPVMGASKISQMPEAVNNIIESQVEEFIAAWSAANSSGVEVSSVGEIRAVPREAEKSQPKAAEAEYKYVSSRKSKVFHTAQCSSAKRISPENLVGYNSRDEAIRTGKRPCRRCKP